jgi:hypothetical protein
MKPQPKQDPSRFRQSSRNTAQDLNYRLAMEEHVKTSTGSWYEKFEHFPRFASRQALSRYFALYEIFKEVLHVQGDIIECGVSWGGALMAFAQISAALEPFNLQRRVIGFDTFAGFLGVSDKDQSTSTSNQSRQGGFLADSLADLERSIELFDANRSIGHVAKVVLVKGDACRTIPQFIRENPHTVVSLLHLDFDLYDPTRAALEALAPRMPKGAVLVFDELNCQAWPGETLAVLETVGLRNLRIRRLPFEPYVSYCTVE